MLPPWLMLAMKKRVALFSALILTVLGPVLFSGCADPGPRALLQGERLVRQTRYAQAIPKLEQAARLLPRDARAWNHLGLAYHGAGRGEDAAKAYRQALAQVQRRRHQDACQQFNAALRVQPGYAPALLNAAIVSHLYLNSRELALEKYRQYLALQPQPPDSAAVQQIVTQLELDLHPA